MPVDLLLASTLALLCVLVLAGIRRVPEGRAYTVHRFGRYARTLRPGWRFVVPMLEKVSAPVELINHRIELLLADLPEASGGASLYYQIVEPERSGGMLDEIDAFVRREARSELESLLASAGRDAELVNQRFKQALNLRLSQLGLLVTRCQFGG